MSTIVHPKLEFVQVRDGKAKAFVVQSIELDANENMFGEPLHAVHALDYWEQARYWYETTDSLKRLIDESVDYVSQDVALGNG